MAVVPSQLEDLLESIDDMVALATLEGKLLYVNRAWREKLGYAPDEVERLSAYDVLHPEHHQEVQATNEKLLAGEVAHGIRRTLIAKDGRSFRVEGSISLRFEDGRPSYVRAIFRDITEREKAEKMKDELLSIANHEMRSPLMAILTSLDLLRQDLQEAPDRTKRFLDLASGNSQRLLDLVNGYLDLDKLASGGSPMSVRPLDLGALVERALELNRPLGERFGVTLSQVCREADLIVDADPDRLVQVVTNLVSNAVKFSKPGGRVRVCVERRDGSARVGVTDEGDGIPEDVRDKIFGKFQQAAVHRRKGTGLGLAISKTIVEQLGGRIGFETQTGKGTTFWFALPERAA
jgi:PAS domain S-box-containing protein